ncbi:g6095 [Coccomyxa viridis]|uniref:G6095 protein n=1 Tax=Coccomyxa viridis TaxID=1274662 RepID=A0ABP1FUK5_9CHLO
MSFRCLEGSLHGQVLVFQSTRCPRKAHAPRRRRLSAQAALADVAITRKRREYASEEAVLIVGAGIAGMATAAALHKVGIPVKVLERESGPRREGSAIGLWSNAFRALDALGLAQPLREAHPPFDRMELCKEDGTVLKAVIMAECDGAPHEFRGVYRGGLLRTLQSGVPSDCIQYNSAVQSVVQDEDGVSVSLENGEQLRAPILVGADGVRSRVAAHLGLKQPNYSGYIAYRGVAKFDGGVPMRKNSMRMLWGNGVRAGIYPLSDSEAYWFTTKNCPADERITDPEECRRDCLESVRGFSHEIIGAIESTPLERITRSRIADRWLPPGRPYGKGRITMCGDGCQPMTPNLGQGGCVALEDAIVLARTLRDALGGSGSPSLKQQTLVKVDEALRNFERERTRRKLKISVKSNLMGAALQIPFAPVVAARNYAVENILSTKGVLDHAMYDCGTL